MKKWKNVLIGCAAIAGLASASSVLASTGAFTGPLTSNLVLSVDVNGGVIASNNTTTEGSNGPSASPTLSADQYGVTWSPWGGPASTNGDGTQLPNSQGGGVQADSISKTFGSIGATVSAAGTLSNYGTNGTGHLNGRDRGSPSGAANDSDLFRDLIFTGASGGNVQSTNYLQVSLTGLNPSATYKVALYSYDSTGSHSVNWTATSPTSNPSNSGHLGYNPDPTDIFTAPADEQTITWTAGTTPAPAVFTVTTDASGAVSLYGWGGDGITGDQNADTTYLNGFQIAAVPEPTSIGLLGVAAVGLLGRRRRGEPL